MTLVAVLQLLATLKTVGVLRLLVLKTVGVLHWQTALKTDKR